MWDARGLHGPDAGPRGGGTNCPRAWEDGYHIRSFLLPGAVSRHPDRCAAFWKWLPSTLRCPKSRLENASGCFWSSTLLPERSPASSWHGGCVTFPGQVEIVL